MDLSLQITDIAHVIQLSVAPVFLVTGIGAMLWVLSFRLSRAVDRARVLEERLPAQTDAQHITAVQRELCILSMRTRLINWAITLCTTSALLICLVIMILFVGAIIGLDIAIAIAVLFILSMAALISSLLIFLKEIQLATSNLRIGNYR
jgi:Na+/melibiose symporter-like transporter